MNVPFVVNSGHKYLSHFDCVLESEFGLTCATEKVNSLSGIFWPRFTLLLLLLTKRVKIILVDYPHQEQIVLI